MTMAILGSALFFVAAPSVVAGLIPWWISGWEFLPPFFELQATRAVGILLIVGGLPGLALSGIATCSWRWIERQCVPTIRLTRYNM